MAVVRLQVRDVMEESCRDTGLSVRRGRAWGLAMKQHGSYKKGRGGRSVCKHSSPRVLALSLGPQDGARWDMPD